MKYLGFKELKSELEILKKENEELKTEIKKQNKLITYNISINKEDFDSAIKKVTENILREKEHKCTSECFGKHVIKAIQKDYDSIDSKNDKLDKFIFINYWHEKLSEEYYWLKCLYIIDGKIYFESK